MSFSLRIRCLRYKDAWDAVLKTGSANAILGMVDELTICGKLEMVLSDREPEELLPVLKFISKNVRDFNVMGGALSLLKAILDKYGPSVSWNIYIGVLGVSRGKYVLKMFCAFVPVALDPGPAEASQLDRLSTNKGGQSSDRVAFDYRDCGNYSRSSLAG